MYRSSQRVGAASHFRSRHLAKDNLPQPRCQALSSDKRRYCRLDRSTVGRLAQRCLCLRATACSSTCRRQRFVQRLDAGMLDPTPETCLSHATTRFALGRRHASRAMIGPGGELPCILQAYRRLGQAPRYPPDRVHKQSLSACIASLNFIIVVSSSLLGPRAIFVSSDCRSSLPQAPFLLQPESYIVTLPPLSAATISNSSAWPLLKYRLPRQSQRLRFPITLPIQMPS